MQNYFDNEATSSALHATMKPARSGKCLVTLSTYEDRKEALLNTTIMEDAGIFRSKGIKNNPPLNTRQQNEALDNTESKTDAHSHIPKPPPFQMTSSENTSKSNHKSQTISAVNSASKSLAMQDKLSAPRLSNNSQNSNANVYNGNDNYSRPNKTPVTLNVNGSGSANDHRQTLRLGTVTIGEYRQQTVRREPEKFDFISTPKKNRDSGDTTPTNEALQHELQNTLTRANLRKANGKSYTEHQRNCPLHQQQQQLQTRHSTDLDNNRFNVGEISKKLQKSSINENNSTEVLYTKTQNRSSANSNGAAGVGILKNGNRNGTSSSSSKSIEKSIKFG